MNNSSMMRQVQQLQAKMVKAQQELAEVSLEVTSGGGVVKVTVTGQQVIQAIKISPEVVNPEDVELLEDLVLAAVSEALTKSQQMASERLEGLTGGLNLPGLGR